MLTGIEIGELFDAIQHITNQLLEVKARANRYGPVFSENISKYRRLSVQV
jgi:hypothetical protein